MDRTTCGWCGVLSHMTNIGPRIIIGDPELEDPSISQRVYGCDNCGHINVATTYDETAHGARTATAQRFDFPNGPPFFVEWMPEHHAQTTFADVPEHIASAARETTLCLSAGAYRAVGSLTRAVVEATAKDKGIKVTGIEAKINALAAAGHLRPDVTATAHEIRHFGNDMAHGDFTDPVTKNQATDMVELMSEVLQEVYQGPARVARIREDREAKKAATKLVAAKQTNAPDQPAVT